MPPDPATRKRGGDPDAKSKLPRAASEQERELEEGLEETMAGSDPVSVIQPAPKHSSKKPAGDRK